MWPNRTLGTIMVPKILIFKKFASQAFYRRVASIHRTFWTKINANSNSRIFSFQVIFQLFLYLWKICNFSKNPWILICIYYGPKCSMDWCDTAIESLKCKLFENKHFGYHYGTPDICWFPADFAVSKLIENHPKSWLPESLRFDQKVTSEFAVLENRKLSW